MEKESAGSSEISLRVQRWSLGSDRFCPHSSSCRSTFDGTIRFLIWSSERDDCRSAETNENVVTVSGRRDDFHNGKRERTLDNVRRSTVRCKRFLYKQRKVRKNLELSIFFRTVSEKNRKRVFNENFHANIGSAAIKHVFIAICVRAVDSQEIRPFKRMNVELVFVLSILLRVLMKEEKAEKTNQRYRRTDNFRWSNRRSSTTERTSNCDWSFGNSNESHR